MIKRVFGVAFFTGAAHLISIATVTYIINKVGEDVAGYIGIVDSYILIISSVISFGIQLSINREIASTDDWRKQYTIAQGARFTLGLVIVGLSALSFVSDWDSTRLVYLYAPLIALNGDYSLYGAGKPLEAARLSFIRVFLPNAGIVVVYLTGSEAYIPVYVLLVGAGIVVSGVLSARINHVKFLVIPVRNFLRYYLDNYKVGVFQVSDVILLSGIIGIVKGYYEVSILGLVYGIYKINILFKGGLRIINQTYFREFSNKAVSSRIDRTTTIFGLLVLVPTLIFPETTLELVFGSKYEGKKEILQFMGLTMFLSSLKASSSTFALLSKRDNLNLVSHLAGVLVAIVVAIVFSYTSRDYMGIPIAIMIGELIILIILGFGLDRFEYFRNRISFVVMFLPLFIAFSLARYYLGEHLWLSAACMVTLLIWVFVFHNKYLLKSKFLFSPDEK